MYLLYNKCLQLDNQHIDLAIMSIVIYYLYMYSNC